jgi:precorrin-3B C17-methyltransferase
MRTFAAHEAICSADVIVGYKVYIDLVRDLTEGNSVDSSGMRDEKERVNRVLDYALSGKKVAIVSSGDPGVYGMAGLVLETCRSRNLTLPVRIIAGITAANSAAALLGAPLSCDYCVLSLSDLLVPPQQILQRAQAAAMGDFVTVLYNPVSTKRKQLILDVRNIFLANRSPQTPVGIVNNISRDGQVVSISTLDIFTDLQLDMMSTIIIGNSQSLIWNGSIINPRGYHL